MNVKLRTFHHFIHCDAQGQRSEGLVQTAPCSGELSSLFLPRPRRPAPCNVIAVVSPVERLRHSWSWLSPTRIRTWLGWRLGGRRQGRENKEKVPTRPNQACIHITYSISTELSSPLAMRSHIMRSSVRCRRSQVL